MGICLGCVGMSLADFEALTVSEITGVCRAYFRQRHEEEQQQWERMRLSVCMTLQPFVSGRLTPQELLPLPWDEKRGTDQPRYTKEQSRKRYEYYRRHGRWPE